MKRLLLIFFLLSSFISFTQSIERDVFGSSGSVMTSTSLEMSFTLGEPFTATLTNNEIHTLGFQQANKSGVSLIELNEIDFGLYPNPASTEINFYTSAPEPYTYKLYDLAGRIILEGKSETNSLILDIRFLEQGKYFFEYTIDDQQSSVSSFITVH